VTEEKAPVEEQPGTRETTPPPKAKPAPKREIRAVVLSILEYLVIGGGLLATGFLSAFITFSMAVRGNEVSVPNLAGASLADANSMLLQAELNLRHEGNRFDESVPPDLVAGQNPPAGTLLKKGRSVRVWTSLGPERRTVPRIEGESLQSAQMILEQEGFTLGRVVEVHSEAYAPDSIIAQNPAPYDEAGEAIEVDVLISRGYLAKAYVMPDFIGHDIGLG
jgi:beta-lactam-binding protein with PASTA domain